MPILRRHRPPTDELDIARDGDDGIIARSDGARATGDPSRRQRPITSSWLTVGSWSLLAATVAAAVALRFVALDHLPGMSGDEAVFAVHAREWLAGATFSELRGGSNRLMDPAFFGVVSLIQCCLPATFWSVRLAGVLHSLLAMVLAFVLFRRRGLVFASTFAALLAVIPIQLGYARLAWDPTAVPTVMMVALAATTRGSVVGTALAFALCLWTHPTTVFATPVLIAPYIAARWRAPDGTLPWPSARALALGGTGVLVCVSLLYLLSSLQVLPTSVSGALRGLPARILDRLMSPAKAARFALLYLEFISGPTIYRYVTGSMPSMAAWLHVVGASALLTLVVRGLRRLPTATKAMDRAIAGGLVLSLFVAYLVGGPRVLEPHTERYGMFLVVPTCYVLATSVEGFATSLVRAAIVRLAMAAVGAALLTSFVAYFLLPLFQVDPARHVTFRTGDIEPKRAALAEIFARRSHRRLTVVSVEDWWIYWPVRYLVGSKSDLFVTIEQGRSAGRPFPRDFKPPAQHPSEAEVFGVAWAGSGQDAEFARRAGEHFDIGGYGPGPILRVHRLREHTAEPVLDRSIERR